MHSIPKKYVIKIPKDTIVLYCKKRNILTIVGSLDKKSIKLQVKLEILKLEKTIIVKPISIYETSNYQKKKIKALQGTTIAIIKQLLIETSTLLYQKLKLVGVGYRVYNVEKFEDKLLLFKLGYSHSIVCKIPDNLNIFCLKFTKLFIYGNSYQEITQMAASTQSHRFPEPYKGKGILYENEKIQLKEGKKV